MILIILPVKNESKTVEATAIEILAFCSKELKDFKIMFIDDNSTDGTFEILEKHNNGKIQVMKNRFDRGKGSTLKTGFILSNLTYKMHDDDMIVFMDGDGQIAPAEIKRLINQMNLHNADVVIGNKRHTYSITKYTIARKIVSFFYNLMVRILFGISYQDTQCGVKIFRRYALEKVIDKVNTKRYAFDLELIIALREMQMFVSDCPVSIKNQRNGGSVSLKNILNTFTDTLVVWVKMSKGLYR